MERIKREVPNLLINVWYLDNSTLCGSPEDLVKALSIVEEDGPAGELVLKRIKFLLFFPKKDDFSLNPLPSDILVSREGFVLLGRPTGCSTYCAPIVLRRVKGCRSFSAFCQTWRIQMGVTLLRSCLSLYKIAFVLQTCPPLPPAATSKTLLHLDTSMFEAVAL